MRASRFFAAMSILSIKVLRRYSAQFIMHFHMTFLTKSCTGPHTKIQDIQEIIHDLHLILLLDLLNNHRVLLVVNQLIILH